MAFAGNEKPFRKRWRRKNAAMKMKGEQRPMRRKIILTVCLVVIGVLAIIGIWQKNNIKALWIVLNGGQQVIAQKKEAQEANRQELLDKYGIGDISEIELSDDDSDLDIQKFLDAVETNDAADLSDSSQGDSSGAYEASQQVIRQCIAALYTLEDQYLGRLNAVVAETKSEYRALPKEEQTKENKLALVNSKVSDLLAMEKQCDSEVELLIQKIQQELDKQGSGNDLVTDIRAAYEDSKATWKAACMTELYK